MKLESGATRQQGSDVPDEQNGHMNGFVVYQRKRRRKKEKKDDDPANQTSRSASRHRCGAAMHHQIAQIRQSIEDLERNLQRHEESKLQNIHEQSWEAYFALRNKLQIATEHIN